MAITNWELFNNLDIRVGTIIKAETFKKAKKPAIKLWIDFGELGTKQSSAQITDLYFPENLQGKQVIAVVNFPPKQIANFISECLVLGCYSINNSVVLLKPDSPVANGSKIG